MNKFLSQLIASLAGAHFRLGVVEPGAGGAGKTVDEQLLELTAKINTRLDKVDAVEKAVAEGKAAAEALTEAVAGVQKQLIALQKAQLAARASRPARKGAVSDDTARQLGAIALCLGAKAGRVRGDRAERVVKDALGLELKAALTESEFALTESAGADVVELVAQFGAARQHGTVFPLGAGSVKLPKLGTDPAFGLIAMSAVVPEKSPSLAWVTFTPAKWGGLIRVPSEIDEDSIVALGQFIARYAARQMAKIEDTLFFAGNGSSAHDNLDGILTQATAVGLATGKTKLSDFTKADLRLMRASVATPALAVGCYYLHPSFEQALNNLNTGGDKPYIAQGLAGASLDGFPIKWVDALPPYSTAASAATPFALFGDLSYHYLGTRGGMRFDTSADAAFATDEILIRALERFTTGLMASDAVSALVTGAAA